MSHFAHDLSAGQPVDPGVEDASKCVGHVAVDQEVDRAVDRQHDVGDGGA